MIEGGTPNTLMRRGVSRDTLKIGTPVVVTGYQAKDGSNRANGRDITYPDGRKLFLGSTGTGAPYRAGRQRRPRSKRAVQRDLEKGPAPDAGPFFVVALHQSRPASQPGPPDPHAPHTFTDALRDTRPTFTPHPGFPGWRLYTQKKGPAEAGPFPFLRDSRLPATVDS